MRVRLADWLTLLDDLLVLGVGSVGPHVHPAYAAMNPIQFPLLSDSAGISAASGVFTGKFDRHRDVPDRASFRVDPCGVVRYAWLAERPADRPTLDALRAAKRGGEHRIRAGVRQLGPNGCPRVDACPRKAVPSPSNGASTTAQSPTAGCPGNGTDPARGRTCGT